MNRYAQAGILADAVNGAEVVVLSHSWNEARAAHVELEARAAAAGLPYGSAAVNGRLGLSFGPPAAVRGRIRFFSAESRAVRGHTADIVFLDNLDADQEPAAYVAARALTATSPRGEIVSSRS